MAFNQPLGGNEMPRFGGPATMMRLPMVESASGLDACFVGVPMDIGTSNRSGARHGPRQIRAESCMMRPYNMGTNAAPFDSLRVADIGDVPINTFNLEKTVGIIEEAFDGILSDGCIPLTLGGGPHALPADPAGHGQGPWAGGADPCRCPCRHQR